MIEDIARVAPMLLLAGLMAGWMAEAVSRAGGYGLMRDLALGITGSLVGGVTAWGASSGPGNMVTMLLIGCGGAAVLLTAQRSFWRSARSAA